MQALPKRLRTPGTGCFMRVRVCFWPSNVHCTPFPSVDLPLLTRCAILAALPRSDVMGRRRFLARRFRFYGLVLSYRSTEDHRHHWKQGRIATAHQAEGEAPVVRVRAIDPEPQAVRHTQYLVVTQKHIETRWVIIKPLTLLQKRRFLERRRVALVAALWLDDIYRVQVKGTKQWKTSVVLSISGYWDQTVVMRDVNDPAQLQFHFTQHDLETGREEND